MYGDEDDGTFQHPEEQDLAEAKAEESKPEADPVPAKPREIPRNMSNYPTE